MKLCCYRTVATRALCLHACFGVIHASVHRVMNHIYRLCWNRTSAQWIVASELAKNDARAPMSRKRTIGQRGLMLSVLAASLFAASVVYAGGGPLGGQITSGSGQIQQLGNTTIIQQSSPTLTLNWQSFNIAPNQTVDFVQPGSSSIAVNRIFSSTPSEIYGHLDANGQVWLINPNGVLFGQGAQVNVGGLVASTLDVDDNALSSNTRTFSGNGTGSIVNRGTITAAKGGYVALLGNNVSNQGVVSAQLGTVALGGGSAITLTFAGDQLLHVQVDQSTLNNLAENRELIEANGGYVIMTAGAKNAILASAVNNTGIIQAQTVENHNGVITLVGGMEAGTVNVGGTLDASAPSGGSGGSIETSAANFNLASNAKITAAAPHGTAGTWLVDPTDLTIDAASATTIDNTLNGGTSVTEQTTATGASGIGVQSAGAGDIDVNAPISWTNSAANLSLLAYHAVNVAASVSGAGKITMVANGANLTIASGATITSAAGVTLATAANFVNDSTGTAVSTGTSSPWLIYSTNPTLDTTGGLTPSFVQYNAPYQTAAIGTGNGFLYSLAPVLRITGLTGTVSKIYDGTTVATLAGSNFTTTGLVNGNVISTATGAYATSNAGTNISVTGPSSISNIAVTTSGGLPAYGYTLSGATPSAAVGTITPKQLTATVSNDPTKVYNGTTSTTAIAVDYSIAGFVAGQGAVVNTNNVPSAFASPTAGTETITATLASTNFTANVGTTLSNYILPTSATGPGTITPAPLLISGVLANNKVYNGTTLGTLNSSNASLYGIISGDAGNVTLVTSGAAGTFSQSNVGNGLAVTAGGYTLTGSKAIDYMLTQPQGLSANITPAALTVSGVIANNKVYDATTSDTLNLTNATLSGLVAGDNVTLSDTGAAGTFNQSNVGNNLAVSATGFSIGGTAASNYTFSQPSGLTADITPAPLTVTLSGNPTKIYDATIAATVPNSDFTVSGFVAGQSATVVQNSSANYASPNAGTNIPITVNLEASDFSAASGTSLSNYSFPASVTGSGTINPIVLMGSIVNNPTKVYDGTTDATLNSANYSLTGLLPGQSITVTQTSGTYGSPNAGVEPVSATLSASNYLAGSGTLLTNYVLPGLMSGFGTITPAPISFSFSAAITGNPTKVYDGNNVATIPAADFTLSGFQGTDSATVNQTITGQYATVNVGAQPVTASMIEADFTPGPGTNLNNYQFPITAFGTGTITPAPLIASIIGNPTKVYNGTTVATITSANIQFTGFVNGEGATATPTSSVNYASPNAGSESVTADLASSDYTANAGTLLSNYFLPTTATGPGTITQAPLYITGVSANNKVYNATTAATLNVSTAGLAGLVSTDVGNVTLAPATTGTFSQSNVGNGLSVTPGTFSISGSEAGNYALVQPTGLTADITPAMLTIAGVIANNKIYDGTTLDSLNTTGATLDGLYAGDTVTLTSTGATGQFSTTNVGNGLAVSTSGFTIGGASASNYIISQPGLTANITPAPLTVTITGNPTKTYDGTDAAQLSAADYTISGFVTGQGATIPQQSSSSYATPNAGTGLEVDATLGSPDYRPNPGTNLANYILPTTAVGDNGVINPVVLNLTGTRVYDANTDAASALFGNAGVLSGINGQTLQLSGTGTLSTKNVGNEQPFAGGGLSGFTLAGIGATLASNYTLVGGTDWVTITPAILTVIDTVAANKVYNGTTVANLSGATLSGVFAGDGVTLGNDTTGTFDNKNAGTNKPVSTDMTISGIDASNYIIEQPTTITANITPLAISVSATGVNKVYNATTTANVNLSSTGVLAGDTVTFSDTSANFNQSNVGTAIPISVLGIAAGGTDGGNYTLINTTASTVANITPRVINLSGTRVYDQAEDANAALFGTSGVVAGVAGQTLNLTGSGVVTSPNVGTYTGGNFGLGTLSLTNGSGLASNYTLIGGTDTLQITPYLLTISGAEAQNKIYNGTTVATITGATLSSPLPGDTVTLSNDTSGTFATKNVGNDIGVTTAMTLSGASAGNYSIVQPTGLEANITPLSIIVSATGQNKVYDTTENAAVTLSGSGIIAGDNITFSDTSALFASPNVANNIPIDVSGITASGTAAGNYTFNTSTTTSANITPVILNLSGTRVYDANTDANASLFGASGVLTGIAGQTLTLNGAGIVSSKNVGTYTGTSQFNLNNLGLTGIGSTLASNYTLIGGTDTLTITPAILTVDGTIASNKVYDGTTIASLSGSTLTGVFTGDNVLLGNDTDGTFATKNAGNGIDVSTNMTISGTDAGNYIIQQPADITADITPKPIVVDATGTNKTYDSTTTATVGLNGSGIIAGDTINFSDTSANFSTANAGIGVPITVDGITASGADAGNYSFNTTATTSANITPAIINLSGTQVYNGTTTINPGSFGTNGVIPGIAGQTLALTGSGTTDSKNIGTYTGSPAFDLGTLALAGNAGSLASNYTLVGGTDTVNITPLSILVTATGDNKVYDGNTTAVVTLSSTAVLPGDTITFTDSAANFTSPNAANNVPIDVTGIVGSGTDLSNYTFNTTTTTQANITPYVLNLTGTRVYDGNTDADANLFGTSGVLNGINGDTLTLSGQGLTSSKNVGSYTNASGFNLNDLTLTGNNSALGSNYTLIGGTDTFTITPLAVTVSASGEDRTYDATTNATVLLTGSGLIGGDVLSFTDTSANFSSPNAGSNVPITVNGITALGPDAGNYTFNTTAATSATINPAVLNLTSTRVYDATADADASLFGTNGVLTGVGGQTLTLTGTGMLDTKNVGVQQPFSASGLSGFTLTGNGSALSSNYTFAGGDDWVTITPATLYVTGTTADSRVYNGTTDATLSGSMLNGVFAGDNVALGNDTAGTFDNKNVGTNKSVTADMTVSGTDASNYILVQPTGLTANITPLGILVDATGANKVYDGNTLDTVGLSSTGVIPGDQISFSNTSADFSDKNVGNGKIVTVDGIADSGADAGNYVLLNTSTTTTANITPLMISFNATGTNKVFNGNDNDITSLTPFGILPGDQVSFTDSSSLFGDPNVGNGKTVTIYGISASGADAGNYIFDTTTTTTANITPLPIDISALGTNRTYNGTDNDAVSLSSTGVLPGFPVNFTDSSALFGSPYVGNDKLVTVSGIAATGPYAEDYVITDPVTTTDADVTGLGSLGTGVQGSWLAQIDGALDPTTLATPYGVADTGAVGVFTGNQKKRHRPVERNVIRSDFRSGLPINVINGGVKLPADASP